MELKERIQTNYDVFGLRNSMRDVQASHPNTTVGVSSIDNDATSTAAAAPPRPLACAGPAAECTSTATGPAPPPSCPVYGAVAGAPKLGCLFTA